MSGLIKILWRLVDVAERNGEHDEKCGSCRVIGWDERRDGSREDMYAPCDCWLAQAREWLQEQHREASE